MQFIKPILAALGIVVGGWSITNMVRAVCSSALFMVLGVFIAIKMIGGAISNQVEQTRRMEMEKLNFHLREKQAQMDHELKLHQIEFDKKLNVKIEIDRQIKEATTKKELLQLQLKADEDQIKVIQTRLEHLRALERAHLSELPLRPINIETHGKTYTNVYWIRNDTMGVLYKTADGCGGGCISYANLTPNSVKLLGLIDDLDTKISNENAYAAMREQQRQAAVAATPQYVYREPQINSYEWAMFNRRYGIGGRY